MISGAPESICIEATAAAAAYLFSVLPASCRQNETMRERPICRRDAGRTLERHHEAPLNRRAAMLRPSPVQARCETKMTQGIQPSAAMLFGHIRQFCVSPLKA